ncbi:MAG: tetratricopeptide repeat protein [Acidimicrobiia bacterium]|nr:tetratricopeptide repeat protein [Acidimicrobiia bacterium]
MSRAGLDDEARAALEDERDFLLASLDDLEVEREAGNVDPVSYRALRDDYTARAAAVLRTLRGEPGAGPSRPPVSWRRRLLVGGGIVVFALVAAALLAGSLGSRLPGGSSGGSETVTLEERREALARAVEDRPDHPDAHLAYARFLDGQGESLEALREYDAVVALDPGRADAHAYGGWLVYRAASSTTDPDQAGALLDTARERLERAVAADPDYPDARFFLGVVLFRGFGDAGAAVPELQRYLALAPDSPLAEDVRAVLAEAEAAG